MVNPYMFEVTNGVLLPEEKAVLASELARASFYADVKVTRVQVDVYAPEDGVTCHYYEITPTIACELGEMELEFFVPSSFLARNREKLYQELRHEFCDWIPDDQLGYEDDDGFGWEGNIPL